MVLTEHNPSNQDASEPYAQQAVPRIEPTKLDTHPEPDLEYCQHTQSNMGNRLHALFQGRPSVPDCVSPLHLLLVHQEERMCLLRVADEESGYCDCCIHGRLACRFIDMFVILSAEVREVGRRYHDEFAVVGYR
jgi:hypothetical protein